MGNPAATLLPRTVLAHLQLAAGDVLQMDLQERRVVLWPVQPHPREGWAEAAKAPAAAGDGQAEWPELDNLGDEDWVW